MKTFGLSLEKDAGFSKLIVITAAMLSGTIFSPAVFMGVLTAQVSGVFFLFLLLNRPVNISSSILFLNLDEILFALVQV